MDNNNYDKAVIIAPRELWGQFYGHRAENPLKDFVLMSQEEVSALFAYQYEDRAITYLMKERDYGFGYAHDLLKAISHLEEGKTYKSQRLNDWQLTREELVKKNLLHKSAYPEKTFEGRRIIVYGYPDLTRIRKCLPLAKIEQLPVKSSSSMPAIHRFGDAYGELHYLFNRILALLKENKKVSIDDIYIYGADSSYMRTLKRMAKAYNFYIDVDEDRKIKQSHIGRAFLREYQEAGLDEAISFLNGMNGPNDLPYVNPLLKALSSYNVKELAGDRQERLILAILGQTSREKPLYKNCVKLLSKPFAPADSHIFFLDFALGNAPHQHKEDDFLSALEKEELGLMNAKEEAVEEKLNLEAFLSSGRIECLSYPKLTIDGTESLESPFLKEFGIKEASNNHLDKEYSSSFASLYLANLRDLKDDYLKDNPLIDCLEKEGIGKEYPFKSYDPQYQGIKVNLGNNFHLSYSSIKTFNQCHFHYYVEKMLKINDDTDSLSKSFGTIAHEVLENRDTKSFDEAWEDSYRNEEDNRKKKGGIFSEKEQVLLRKLKEEFRITYDFINELDFSKIVNPSFSYEQKISIPIKIKSSGQPVSFPLICFIDKAVTLGDNREYLVIIDYKSGSERFEEKKLEYGLSLQLPIYALAASYAPEFKDKALLGLFINPLLDKNPIDAKKGDREAAIKAECRLNGVFLNDRDAMAKLYPDLGKNDDHILGGKYGNNGFDGKSKRFKGQKELEGYRDLALALVEKAGESILDNDFEIAPLKGEAGDACEFCPYRDICYVRFAMYNYGKLIDRTPVSADKKEDC